MDRQELSKKVIASPRCGAKFFPSSKPGLWGGRFLFIQNFFLVPGIKRSEWLLRVDASPRWCQKKNFLLPNRAFEVVVYVVDSYWFIFFLTGTCTGMHKLSGCASMQSLSLELARCQESKSRMQVEQSWVSQSCLRMHLHSSPTNKQARYSWIFIL